MIKVVQGGRHLVGEMTIDADKSISHRAVLFAALAEGDAEIRNFLIAEDTLSTLACIQRLGVNVRREGNVVWIRGKGAGSLREPAAVLDCGNSGTTMRLMAGVLAGCPFFSVLSGDESLNRRPMRRVIEPLKKMGADIQGRQGGHYAPLAVRGGQLRGMEYDMPIASAQVKSCLLLAGLQAEGATVINEPGPSRNHTELMLQAMGADLTVQGPRISLNPGKVLTAQDMVIPGDISSAAFFAVAALIVPGSELLIKDVGLNPGRCGVIEILRRMGAAIKIENQRLVCGEKVGDLVAACSSLKGISLDGSDIGTYVDEIPILAVAMAAAEGFSEVSGAAELRVKETDRIAAICRELGAMGVDITEKDDGFIINGNREGLRGAEVDSHGDHRIAMSLAVAALIARGPTSVKDARAVEISFPRFWEELERF